MSSGLALAFEAAGACSPGAASGGAGALGAPGSGAEVLSGSAACATSRPGIKSRGRLFPRPVVSAAAAREDPVGQILKARSEGVTLRPRVTENGVWLLTAQKRQRAQVDGKEFAAFWRPALGQRGSGAGCVCES